jgi:hypothetical protein
MNLAAAHDHPNSRKKRDLHSFTLLLDLIDLELRAGPFITLHDTSVTPASWSSSSTEVRHTTCEPLHDSRLIVVYEPDSRLGTRTDGPHGLQISYSQLLLALQSNLKSSREFSASISYW